jgi:hypothetical protein
MTRRTLHGYGWIAALSLASAGAALAADPQTAAPADPTPAARQQMAEIHEKMAACLRSDRPIAECRAEMWKSCQSITGEGGCPMGGGLGPGMMGRGKRYGPGMMQGGAGQQEPAK